MEECGTGSTRDRDGTRKYCRRQRIDRLPVIHQRHGTLYFRPFDGIAMDFRAYGRATEPTTEGPE